MSNPKRRPSPISKSVREKKRRELLIAIVIGLVCSGLMALGIYLLSLSPKKF